MSNPHHMRRTDREITDPGQIEHILGSGRYVVIALVDGAEPYIVTLSYGYDASAGALYSHVALEGHKLDIIERNPAACGTVVLDRGYNQGECEHPYESVVMRGKIRLVDDPAEKLHAIRTLVEHLEDAPESYWESRSWKLEQRIDGFSALCFEIESMTAKRGK